MRDCETRRLAAAEPGHRALSSAALPLDGAPSTHILKPQPWVGLRDWSKRKHGEWRSRDM